MKPEPLKKKDILICLDKEKKLEGYFFHKDNVKSAVEWLIKWVEQSDIRPSHKRILYKRINEAFEDVIKK